MGAGVHHYSDAALTLKIVGVGLWACSGRTTLQGTNLPKLVLKASAFSPPTLILSARGAAEPPPFFSTGNRPLPLILDRSDPNDGIFSGQIPGPLPNQS